MPNATVTYNGKPTHGAEQEAWYTAKTVHGTSGSRSAISTALTVGCALTIDIFGHDKGKGVDVTRALDDAQGDNLDGPVFIVTGFRDPTIDPFTGSTVAQWVKGIWAKRGDTVDNVWVKANVNVATPTYLGLVSGQFELGPITLSGTADALNVKAIGTETADTSSTAARKTVVFI